MKIPFSRTQIRDIAKATCRLCSKDGRGASIVVHDDGSWREVDRSVYVRRGRSTIAFTVFRSPARESDVIAAIRDELHFRRMAAGRKQA